MQPFERLMSVWTQTELSKALGITPAAVCRWRHIGIPANRVPEIVRISRGRLTMHDLRPDLFDPEPNRMPTGVAAA